MRNFLQVFAIYALNPQHCHVLLGLRHVFNKLAHSLAFFHNDLTRLSATHLTLNAKRALGALLIRVLGAQNGSRCAKLTHTNLQGILCRLGAGIALQFLVL